PSSTSRDSVWRPQPTFATARNEDDGSETVLSALKMVSKTKASNGSSIAAGLCPWFPDTGIDISVTLARRTHAVILAIGATATGGEFAAIPLRLTDAEKADRLARAQKTQNQAQKHPKKAEKWEATSQKKQTEKNIVIDNSFQTLLKEDLVKAGSDVFLVVTA